ncbi:MAG: helix-turn-helix domain-containing protein [Ignavibacteriaceae bacterium]|nr:helix-turn-helix domain-containing protein [Ignavibacteriaceae bacterium]
MLKKFTTELKEQREKVGITLQNVAAKTRIDIKFLEALEDGNFNFLPELYVKAFIKQYAKVVGLDEEETLQKYILAKEGKEEAVEKANQENTGEKKQEMDNHKTNSGVETNKPAKIFTDDNTRKKSNEDDKKKQKQIIIGGSIIGAALLLLIIYFVFINVSDDIIVEEKPFEEVLQETPNRYIEQESNQTTEEKIEAKIEELTLTITNVDSTDSAWVFVIVDNKSVEDFLLLPKISKTIKANNNFYFTLGNSGVVKLIFNSKELEFNGRRRAIRYFKLDTNGLERVYTPPKLNNE